MPNHQFNTAFHLPFEPKLGAFSSFSISLLNILHDISFVVNNITSSSSLTNTVRISWHKGKYDT